MSQGSCHPREISPWLLDFPSGCSTSKVASWGSCWAAVLGLKLTYRYLIGLLQGVHNVVLESLSYVKAKHHLKMKLHALAERRPTFGGSLGMWDSKDILPKHLCHLGLYDFLPRLLGFIREKFSVEFKRFCACCCDSKLHFLELLCCFLPCFLAVVMVDVLVMTSGAKVSAFSLGSFTFFLPLGVRVSSFSFGSFAFCLVVLP